MKCHRYGKQSEKKETVDKQDTLLIEGGNEDKTKRKTNVQVKTDCKCVMVVREEKGIWKVVRLDLEHNHELSPKDRNQLFSGKKYMTDMEKGIIKTLNDNNIPIRKMIVILSYLKRRIDSSPIQNKRCTECANKNKQRSDRQ